MSVKLNSCCVTFGPPCICNSHGDIFYHSVPHFDNLTDDLGKFQLSDLDCPGNSVGNLVGLVCNLSGPCLDHHRCLKSSFEFAPVVVLAVAAAPALAEFPPMRPPSTFPPAPGTSTSAASKTSSRGWRRSHFPRCALKKKRERTRHPPAAHKQKV